MENGNEEHEGTGERSDVVDRAMETADGVAAKTFSLASEGAEVGIDMGVGKRRHRRRRQGIRRTRRRRVGEREMGIGIGIGIGASSGGANGSHLRDEIVR